jgi:hypothetical protein
MSRRSLLLLVSAVIVLVLWTVAPLVAPSIQVAMLPTAGELAVLVLTVAVVVGPPLALVAYLRASRRRGVVDDAGPRP